MKIEFLLMKIDDWEEDSLHMYANDLLVMNRNFGRCGNQICFEENQTELLSFEEFVLEDNNKTMTI